MRPGNRPPRIIARMTPFDPTALLAILLTFYPVVSVAALRLARAERPEYFSGGTLGGSKGEKLTLPDGRIFDLIFAVDGPDEPRWQVIDVTHAGGGVDDAFGLAPGPLRPIDLAAFPTLTPIDTFAPLVGAALADLVGSDATYERAHDDISEALTGGSDLDDVFAATVGTVPDVVRDLHRDLDYIEPSDVAQESVTQSNAAYGNEAPYTEVPE